jgi:drug/metabolite transporter (DMT)-like permease
MIGELSALLTAFLWSFTSIFFSSAARRVGSFQLNIDRLIIASVFLFLTITIAGFDISLSARQIFFLSMSGFIGLVFGDSFLFKAYQTIGPRLSILLLSLSPAITALLAFIFLNERISASGLTGMGITLAGIMLVVMEKTKPAASKFKADKKGIFNGLMGALGQAGGLILAKAAFEESDINGMTATFVRILASVVVIVPLGIIIRRYRNPIKLYRANAKALWLTIGGTIVGPYLGITFSLIAIANTKVGIAATLMSIMPIIMLPLMKIIHKEKLNWRAYTGAFLAVGGIAILFLR